MNPKHFLGMAVSFSLALGAARAQVIFADAFDTGTGDWYIGSTVNQSGDSTLANSSGQLQFTVGSAQNKDEVIGRTFAGQTLEVGQTIRLTFDFRQTVTTAIIRAGFTNRSAAALAADGWCYTTSGTGSGTYAGYYSFIRDNSATGNVARKDPSSSFTNADNAGAPTFGTTTITSPANFTQFDINDDGTVTYQGSFEVTRTASGVTTLFTLQEGATVRFSVSGVDNTGAHTSFNTALLRLDQGTGYFDNIKVEVAPDLSTPAPFRLVITRNGANYDFEWDSKPGKLYDLITSTDLATPIATWPVHDPDGPGGVDPFGDIPSAGATTTILTGVPSSDPRRFFSIREKSP